MSIKVELGKKIRKLREEQGLSRSELCDTEEELTVRQLARIESGESLPTLPKLEFIAERLSVSMSLLVDRKYVELPQRYIQLKHQLYKAYTYSDKERVSKKEQLFDEIYKNYYDNLPEEEQLSIDVQKITMNVHLTENANFGSGILNDYFSQILHKEEYSINDLLIINLYFHCIYYKDYNEELFISMFNKIIKQIDNYIDLELFLLINLMMSAIGVFLKYENYEKLIVAVKICNVIIQRNQDFQKKPVIDMVEGKYYLFAQRDINLANQKFEAGAKFAEMMGDLVLSQKILEEWKLDLAIFKQQDLSSN